MDHKITDLISPEIRRKLITDLKEAEKKMNGDPNESLIKKHWIDTTQPIHDKTKKPL